MEKWVHTSIQSYVWSSQQEAPVDRHRLRQIFLDFPNNKTDKTIYKITKTSNKTSTLGNKCVQPKEFNLFLKEIKKYNVSRISNWLNIHCQLAFWQVYI